ncbi:hypothetical protein [Streptomyces aidingensis]|uniref:Uncharacterized protein n=1 Tax=Streptomyces aidingensis TaxID=910347 RepID=A0A1I1MUM1_9ACTN|nr:hypothetical protein [Streptomyces aidingensis]SFC89114.1 hypothetical protein SAMN05421773_10775 [Streptomyces aidingensis]
MQAHHAAGDYRDSVRTTVRLVLWTFAWAATLALARFGPENWWDSQQPAASWAAVAVNLAAGIGWIAAFSRFLRAQDELQRKIVQDALEVTLAAGWVGGFAYVVADAADLVTHDLDIAALFPVLLGVVFLGAVLVGKIRYR